MKNNTFRAPVLDIIRKRSSIRSFSDTVVTTEVIVSLKSYIESLNAPFNGKVRFEFLSESDELEKLGAKIGTYGIIKGAKNYVAIIGDANEDTLLKIGYLGESLVLYMTSLGLGTCWMGGTYDKGAMRKLLSLDKDEKLYIVIPFGYPLDKRSRVDYFMRFAAGSNQRKSWEEIFFIGKMDNPILEDEEEYLEALEGVRMSPSASNKQPWVVIKRNHHYDFYLRPTPGYGETLGFKIQEIDIGIAMCHFQYVLNDHGISGEWKRNNSSNNNLGKLVYVSTWIEEGR